MRSWHDGSSHWRVWATTTAEPLSTTLSSFPFWSATKWYTDRTRPGPMTLTSWKIKFRCFQSIWDPFTIRTETTFYERHSLLSQTKPNVPNWEVALSLSLSTFVLKKKSGRIGCFNNLVKGNNFLSIGQAMWLWVILIALTHFHEIIIC